MGAFFEFLALKIGSKKNQAFWKCSTCKNCFTTFHFEDSLTDNDQPKCCPICGIRLGDELHKSRPKAQR